MSELTEQDVNRVAVFAARHYVPFSYYAHPPNLSAENSLASPCVCSGFIMQVRDIWCVVTAGHVLDEIEKEREAGFKLVNFRLWDGWGPAAKFKNYLPFDFDAVPKVRVNNNGLDYGIFPLSPLLVDGLRANGVVPIGEEHYEKDWPNEFHAYAMIGTPSSTVSLKSLGGQRTQFQQSTLIIHLAEEKYPPETLVLDFPRFYGRILAPEDSEGWQAIGADISGMSGGPILAMRKEGHELRYWVIGIQSGWLASERIIAATYFKDFALLVAKMIDGAQ